MQLPTDTLDKSKKYYVTFTINHSPAAAAARRANGRGVELGVEGKAAAKGRRVNGRYDLDLELLRSKSTLESTN